MTPFLFTILSAEDAQHTNKHKHSAGARIGTHSSVGGSRRALQSCSCHSREVKLCRRLLATASRSSVSDTCFLVKSVAPVALSRIQ